MNRRSGWLGAPEAQLPSLTFQRLGVQFHQVVQLSLAVNQYAFRELTTCLVQLIPYGETEHPNTILLDLALFDFLAQASEMRYAERCAEECEIVTQDGMFIGASNSPPESLTIFTELTRSSLPCWCLKTVPTVEARDTVDSRIFVEVQYMPLGERILTMNALDPSVKDAMQHRWVMPGTFVMLSLTSDEYAMVVLIRSINKSKEKIAYRLGARDTFCVSPSMTFSCTRHYFDTTIEKHCHDHYKTPLFGYGAQIESILQLVAVNGSSSPAGILLVGCAGVGKTRLLSCLKGILQEDRQVHHISLKELLPLAASSSEEALFKKMCPPEPSSQMILLMDDLDVLQISDAPVLSEIDQEKRLVLNYVLLTLDRLAEHGSMAIAVGQSTSGLPFCLLKAGRFEKVITMNPPTQKQREFILMGFLHLFYDDVISRKWSERLASITGGCVASDLHRLAVDATTNISTSDKIPSWRNWETAALACLPSHLIFFDVKRPCLLLEEDTTDNWLEIHNHGWRTFIGYASLKTRVYRTIVVPWRRQLSRNQMDHPALSALAPPSGVLFHGQSGCGKTLAAFCLGSSLGLSMIKVRAGDVLDKWLGGSEGIIRRLFTKARAAAPCILFFDEIDAIASDRGMTSKSTDVMSRLLSTMLNEMDGISSGSEKCVLVVACTNRLESLDKSLLRPGRLEEQIEVQNPTAADALEILQWYFASASLDEGLDLKSVVKFLFHRSVRVADLEGVARESVFRSLRRQRIMKRILVTESDVMEAIHALKLL